MMLIPPSSGRTDQHYYPVAHLTQNSNATSLVRRSHTFSVLCVFAIFLAISVSPAIGSLAFAKDALGSATVKLHSGTGACPSGGLTNGKCWDVTITGCPETGDTATSPFLASVKVNAAPNGSPIGFVFFTTGGGGDAYYDNFSSFISTTDTSCPAQGSPVTYNCGKLAVQTVNDANFTTLQTNFSDPNLTVSEPAGWLTSKGTGSTNGPRAMACRYATLVKAVWNSTIVGKTTTKPICASGNSAGSSAAAYALTQYGMSVATSTTPLLSMVEASSGPPMGRVDHGCSHTPQCYPVTCGTDPKCSVGGQIKEGYGLKTALQFIDPAYDGDSDLDFNGITGKYEPEPLPLDPCANSINGASGTYPNFLHDSVWSDDYSAPNFPHTFVNFVFGATDGTSAVPLGTEWYNAITSSKPVTPACVANTGHQVPGTFAGATQVANDLNTMCKLY